MLQDVADDFVENLAAYACELAVHRGGQQLEAKDLQLALGARASVLCTVLSTLTCFYSWRVQKRIGTCGWWVLATVWASSR